MRHKKTFFFSILAVVSLFSFSACQAQDQEKDIAQTNVDADAYDFFSTDADLSFAISERLEEFYRAIIGKFCQDHPDLEVSVTVIPTTDNSSSEEAEAKKQEIEAMKVKIMAGKGPDLFLLDQDNLLFPDIMKNCNSGTFLDLEPLLGAALSDANLNETVLEAGMVSGKRYLLPLGYSVSGIVTTQEWLQGWQPSSETPAAFLQEVLEHGGFSKYEPVYTLSIDGFSLCAEPLLDYEQKEIQLSQNLKELMAFALEQHDTASSEVELPVTLLEAGSYIQQTCFMMFRQILMQGETPCFLPVPNGSGGVTARINTYAAALANTSHSELAAEFLMFALSDSMQGASEWNFIAQGKKISSTFPVNQNAVIPSLMHFLNYDEGLPEENFQQVAEAFSSFLPSVNTARFTVYEDALLLEYVMQAHEIDSQLSLEKCLENLQEELRFYFDE